MIELTSGWLSIGILVVAIVSIFLYFFGVSWAGLYVTFFLITAVINCAAQAYWAWTEADDEVEGGTQGGGLDDERAVNAAPTAKQQAYYNQEAAKLASKTPDVHSRI